MKDLYLHLGLSPNSSQSNIRRRSSTVDGELKKAVQEILLDERRRQIYDRNYRTLKIVGELRERLDLVDGSNWKESSAQDFAGQNHKEPEQRSQGTAKSNRSQTDKAKENSSRPTSNSQRSSSVWPKVRNITQGFGGCLLNVGTYFAGIFVIMVFCGILSMVIEKFGDSSSSSVQSQQSPSSVVDEPRIEKEPQTSSSGVQGEGVRSDTKEPSFSVPSQPLPSNGKMWAHTSAPRIAPLRVSVSFGSHYYIKVVRFDTTIPVVSFIVRSGQRAEVEVPTGSYELKYATGETWYGPEYLFGPDTKYYEAEDIMYFRRSGQQVEGYYVELIAQEGGNLRTSTIHADKF